MIILNEINRLYLLDSLTSPLPEGSRFHWTFSAQQLDFMLSEMQYLEEYEGSCVSLITEDSTITVPTSWNVMIVDRETYTVEMIPAHLAAVFNHDVMVFSPTDTKLQTVKIRVDQLLEDHRIVYPSFDKSSAMVYGIAPKLQLGRDPMARGIIVGPSDLFRYINRKTVGDILS
jgi:hypothetical protein